MSSLTREYGSGQLSDRQIKDINNARARAVSRAWSREKEYVKEGKGTRDWTPQQQEDILNNGNVQGFEGHHMRSVSNGKTYEEQMRIAEDKDNIQFLEKTKDNNEHLAAHGGNTQNRTNGQYDPKTGNTRDFGTGAPQAPKAEKLSDPVSKESKKEESHVDQYGVDHSKTGADHGYETERSQGRKR